MTYDLPSSHDLPVASFPRSAAGEGHCRILCSQTYFASRRRAAIDGQCEEGGNRNVFPCQKRKDGKLVCGYCLLNENQMRLRFWGFAVRLQQLIIHILGQLGKGRAVPPGQPDWFIRLFYCLKIMENIEKAYIFIIKFK